MKYFNKAILNPPFPPHYGIFGQTNEGFSKVVKCAPWGVRTLLAQAELLLKLIRFVTIMNMTKSQLN